MLEAVTTCHSSCTWSPIGGHTATTTTTTTTTTILLRPSHHSLCTNSCGHYKTSTRPMEGNKRSLEQWHTTYSPATYNHHPLLSTSACVDTAYMFHNCSLMRRLHTCQPFSTAVELWINRPRKINMLESIQSAGVISKYRSRMAHFINVSTVEATNVCAPDHTCYLIR